MGNTLRKLFAYSHHLCFISVKFQTHISVPMFNVRDFFLQLNFPFGQRSVWYENQDIIRIFNDLRCTWCLIQGTTICIENICGPSPSEHRMWHLAVNSYSLEQLRAVIFHKNSSCTTWQKLTENRVIWAFPPLYWEEFYRTLCSCRQRCMESQEASKNLK